MRFEGLGLHSGEPCAVTVALGGEGIVFKGASGLVRAGVVAVRSSELCTTLHDGAFSVSTVEHLLAALAGLGHFAAQVEVEGPEVPILDGSALPFVSALPDADAVVPALLVEKSFELSIGAAAVQVEPQDQLEVDYTIEFPVRGIGRQRLVYTHGPAAFRAEIAPARTFTLAAYVEELRHRGLIRGGALSCAVVFGEDGPLNPPLRFPDEPVRHKVLDLLGDLALLGRPLQARLCVQRGGHALHAALCRELLGRLAAGDGVWLSDRL